MIPQIGGRVQGERRPCLSVRDFSCASPGPAEKGYNKHCAVNESKIGLGGIMELPLNSDERAWLEEYRQELRRRYPGVVADLRVFDYREQKKPSPKRTVAVAVTLRGSSDPEQSHIDLNWLGDCLARGSAVTPLVYVYTPAQWERSLRRHSLPYKSAGVSVWEKDSIADIPGEEWALPPWARPDSWRLHLKLYEKEWLAAYRQALREKYPGLVKDLRVFAHHDGPGYIPRYSISVVVTIASNPDSPQLAKDIEELSHHAAGITPAMPYTEVYTAEEWQRQRQDDTLPYEGEGTSVWLK